MRPGVAFPHRHPHELAHLRPLMQRLQDVLVAPPQQASVVVHADTRPPLRGSWNVQVFHGLGDKGYTANPLFLQAGRRPRLRTAANMTLGRLTGRNYLAAPARPGRRHSRYQQVNAYGPRWVDLLASFLEGVEVSRFGHVALNDTEGLAPDWDGPVVWMPTWDNRRYLGGPNQSSLEPFADAVAAMAKEVPVLVKLHPLTVTHGQAQAVRRRLASAQGVTFADAAASPYELLHGARGLLTDTSSLGFEAYCAGLPVAIAHNPGVAYAGLHRELAERATVLEADQPAALRQWAEAPPSPTDTAWARDLLYAPQPRRNDQFAAQLRAAAVANMP